MKEIEIILKTLIEHPLFVNKYSQEKLYGLYHIHRDAFETLTNALVHSERYYNSNECWNEKEKAAFEEGFRKYHKSWKQVRSLVCLFILNI